jgi:hypothetical protein
LGVSRGICLSFPWNLLVWLELWFGRTTILL